MSEPISAALVAHEFFHAAAQHIVGGGRAVRFIKVGSEECIALEEDSADTVVSSVGGPIVEALVASGKPESIAKALLQVPDKTAEIVVQLASPSDWEKAKDAPVAELRHAVRQATLIAWALQSNGVLSDGCQIVADDIGTRVGMLCVNFEAATEFLKSIFESAEQAAALPDALWASPEFAEHQLTQFDLQLEKGGEGFEGLCTFSPMAPEMLASLGQSQAGVMQ